MFPNCTFDALYCERISAKKEKISALQLRFISATIAVKIGEVCTWNRKSCWRRCTQRKNSRTQRGIAIHRRGRHESVAEHSWRIALMAFWLRDEFPQADMDKVIRMCLIHDLGECFTGDIPAFDKTAADEAAEEALLSRWSIHCPSRSVPRCGRCTRRWPPCRRRRPKSTKRWIKWRPSSSTTSPRLRPGSRRSMR